MTINDIDSKADKGIKSDEKSGESFSLSLLSYYTERLKLKQAHIKLQLAT